MNRLISKIHPIQIFKKYKITKKRQKEAIFKIEGYKNNLKKQTE